MARVNAIGCQRSGACYDLYTFPGGNPAFGLLTPKPVTSTVSSSGSLAEPIVPYTLATPIEETDLPGLK
jgi:hypothetical protein